MRRRHNQCSRRVIAVLAVGAFLGVPAWGTGEEEVEVLRERYIGTLRILAAEGIESATRSLVDLETGIASQQGASGLAQLRELELEVATELASKEARLLLPLIALHEQAHLAYSVSALAADPYHARAMLFLQIELYSERVRAATEREIASDLFVSLAGYFQEGSAGPGAAALYTRALLFDPVNEAALLGLAIAREQLGRYRNALSLLERLAETGSTDGEARLRLAINLERLGERGAAGILDSLTRESADDWVAVVAFQELARIRLNQGGLEAARDLLARGLARYPQDPGLGIGLTWVEDRLGLSSERPLVVTEPQQPHEAAASSARYLYARPDYPYLEETRNRLREQAIQYLPHLAETLSALWREVE